jgi:hypothetical protein
MCKAGNPMGFSQSKFCRGFGYSRRSFLGSSDPTSNGSPPFMDHLHSQHSSIRIPHSGTLSTPTWVADLSSAFWLGSSFWISLQTPNTFPFCSFPCSSSAYDCAPSSCASSISYSVFKLRPNPHLQKGALSPTLGFEFLW